MKAAAGVLKVLEYLGVEALSKDPLTSRARIARGVNVLRWSRTSSLIWSRTSCVEMSSETNNRIREQRVVFKIDPQASMNEVFVKLADT